mmetsp:Transcript_26744/g.72163  ORF Transcript_26744/g.72163 Transcript_26744/m.72163 type:complete len:261 (-) Transcript_26744:155-937(-)
MHRPTPKRVLQVRLLLAGGSERGEGAVRSPADLTRVIRAPVEYVARISAVDGRHTLEAHRLFKGFPCTFDRARDFDLLPRSRWDGGPKELEDRIKQRGRVQYDDAANDLHVVCGGDARALLAKVLARVGQLAHAQALEVKDSSLANQLARRARECVEDEDLPFHDVDVEAEAHMPSHPGLLEQGRQVDGPRALQAHQPSGTVVAVEWAHLPVLAHGLPVGEDVVRCDCLVADRGEVLVQAPGESGCIRIGGLVDVVFEAS